MDFKLMTNGELLHEFWTERMIAEARGSLYEHQERLDNLRAECVKRGMTNKNFVVL